MIDSWFLYFIEDVTAGLIKIGIAKDVVKRKYELQTGNANKLRLLGKAKFATEFTVRRFEKRVHDLFVSDWVRGEWFKTSDTLRAVAATAR